MTNTGFFFSLSLSLFLKNCASSRRHRLLSMSVSSRQKALTTNSRRLSSLAASPDFKYQPSGHDIFSSASAAGPERLLPRVLKSDRRTSAVTGLFSWSQHSVHLLSACNTLGRNSTVKPSHTHTNNRGSSGSQPLTQGPRLHQGKGAARHSTGRHTSHLAFTSGVLHDTFLPGGVLSRTTGSWTREGTGG